MSATGSKSMLSTAANAAVGVKKMEGLLGKTQAVKEGETAGPKSRNTSYLMKESGDDGIENGGPTSELEALM